MKLQFEHVVHCIFLGFGSIFGFPMPFGRRFIADTVVFCNILSCFLVFGFWHCILGFRPRIFGCIFGFGPPFVAETAVFSSIFVFMEVQFWCI